MSPLGRCLLSEDGCLTLEPWHPDKKPGVVAHTCNPVLMRQRQVDPGGSWSKQLRELASTRLSERPCLENKVETDWRRHLKPV